MAAAPLVALSPPRRLLVIFNPASGRGRRAERRLARVVAALEARGCTVVVRRTQTAGDAERLAGAAEPDFDALVAAGGDGTINEIVNGMASAPRPLALIPLGTANVLAHEIGLPKKPRRLAAVIAEGRPQPVWPGCAGGRLFVMMLGAGFDAAVLARVDPRQKRRFGKLAFLSPILGAWLGWQPAPLTVRIDGHDHSAASVVVAKGPFYAGRFVLAPAARLQVPLLQVVMLRRPHRWALLRLIVSLPFGLAHRLSDVAILPARALHLTGAGPDPIQVDGELHGVLPLEIGIAAAPLPIIQPG